MDDVTRNAIETVDNARQHKCELEGRLDQLNACISQVSITSDRTKDNINNHFASLQKKILNQIEMKKRELVRQVNEIEKEALEPLKECKSLLKDGIQEAASVIESGENLLQNEDNMNSDGNIKKLNKFMNMANGLSLDSVPEVPSTTEVASVSFHFDETDFDKDLCTAILHHGEISKQAPVQITELEPRPGGMVISWDETDGDVSVDWIENGNTVLYKLQYCQGKISFSSQSELGSLEYFHEAYIGKNNHHTINKLLPNTVYTFRVCRCLLPGGDISTAQHWSPWSVYQDGITTFPGYEWVNPMDRDIYTLQDKCRVATKKSNSSQILYSKDGGYIIGFPITFKIENEGKTHSLGDGFALITDTEPTNHSIVKDGSICVSADGRIFINGIESQTHFANFCRNMTVRFSAREIKTHDVDSLDGKKIKGKKTKGKSLVTLRVAITAMEKEAVFDWRVPRSSIATHSSNRICLSFAAAFKSPNWKFSVL